MKELIIHYIQQVLPYFSAAAVAFVISCLMTPLSIRVASKIGAMDVPKDNRRMHKKAMPRFGGMAIFAGTEISLAIFCHSDPKVIAILVGGVLIYAVGVLDDLKGLPAKLKFLLQILCAIAIYIGGIRIDFIKNPLYHLLGDDSPLYLHFPLAISLIITVIWIVGITNTINLIDGLDGLAAGVAVIASGYISYAAVLSGQYGVGLAMIAVTGGALGFLPFNFHPAKTFMGDSGSLYLGFMIASISVLGSTKGATLIVTIVPFLALGLPIFDTIFAIIRRWINGTPIMEADKGHLHHRIMNTGIGQRRTVLIMYCISAIMGMVAIMVVRREMLEALILTIVGAILLCVFVADHSSLREIMQEGIPQTACGSKREKHLPGSGARGRKKERHGTANSPESAENEAVQEPETASAEIPEDDGNNTNVQEPDAASAAIPEDDGNNTNVQGPEAASAAISKDDGNNTNVQEPEAASAAISEDSGKYTSVQEPEGEK